MLKGEIDLKTKPVIWLALLTVLALVLAACGSAEETVDTTAAPVAAETTTTTTEAVVTTTTEAEEMIELVIWADEKRSIAIAEVVPAFEAETGVDVIIELVDFGAMKDQVGVAGPAGEGPDIFIGASDWVGELATNGILEPIDLGAKADDFITSAKNGLTFNGTLYGVPYAVEAIALYYNTDLAPEAPASMEDAAAACADMVDITNCIGVTGGGDGTDAYHMYPFVSAAGGYVFASTDGVYDPTDVGLDSAGAISGAVALETLVKDGVMASVNYDGAKNQFLDGTEPFWITGPWELGALNDQDTVNWAVAKLPKIADGTPQPFVGVQGFFLSSFSENKLVAQTFLLDFMATEEGMAAMFAADGRPPVHNAIIAATADDLAISTFGASAADGVPIPNIPEMGAVWGALGDNMAAIRNGTVDAETAMVNAATAVREAVNQ